MRLPQGDGHVRASEGYQVFEDLGGYGYEVGRCFDDGDADPRGFRADSEDSRFAVANDVYFDVLALCV